MKLPAITNIRALETKQKKLFKISRLFPVIETKKNAHRKYF